MENNAAGQPNTIAPQAGNSPAYPSLPLTGLVILQCALSVYGLFKETLWVDEAYSAVIARRPFSAVHSAMQFDAGPPLYYDLLHIWRMLFGESEVALRSMSLLFAVITTVLIYRFTMYITNRQTAFFASLIWVCSPLSLYYCVEARNYTMFAAITVAYFYALAVYAKTMALKPLCISAAILVVGLYTHNLAMFLIPMALIVMYTWTFQWKPFLHTALSQFTALVLYLPWVPTLFRQFENSEMTIAWVKNAWSPGALLDTFTTFVPGGGTSVFIDLPQFPYVTRIALYLLLAGLLINALVFLRKQKDRNVFGVCTSSLDGLLIPYLYSFLTTPIYLAGRTDFFVFPFWCVWAGYAASALPKIHLRYAALGIVVTASLVIHTRHTLSVPPYREAVVAQYLHRYAKPGDVVLCTGLTRPLAEYELVDSGVAFVSYPPDMAQHLAHINEQVYFSGYDLLSEGRQCISDAAQKCGKDGTLWVIYSERLINQKLSQLLDESAVFQNKAVIDLPGMGLRRINEPLTILKYQYVQSE